MPDDIAFEDITGLTLIGKGTFGSVYKADYLGTDVAIKECFKKVPEAPEWSFEKYYAREVQLLKEARHPNIVQFMGTCKSKDTVYIVTEFVNGGNWIVREKERLEKSKDPNQLLASYRLRISFAIDITRALAYLHAHDIIHRDLKLENLLLTENLRVCDFGFSRFIPNAKEDHARLSFCGTDGYMAPEVILCMDDYTKSVDVFSLGVILLSLFALNVPKGDGPSDIPPFRRVIPGFGLDEAEVRESLSEKLIKRNELYTLIMKCVNEDSSKRISIKEILQILKDTELAILDSLSKSKMINAGIADENTPSVLDLTDAPINYNYKIESDIPTSAPPIGSYKGITSPLSPDPVPTSAPLTKPTPFSSDSLFTDFDSTPKAIRAKKLDQPHRFTIVFSPMSMHTLKCDYCHRQIQTLMHSHLSCDDCGFICHKKCSRNVPPHCKPGTSNEDIKAIGSRRASGAMK